MSTNFHLEGFRNPVAGVTSYILEDRQHALSSEVMNSRDEPQRITWGAQPAGITGREFKFTFRPLSVTLLELKLSR